MGELDLWASLKGERSKVIAASWASLIVLISPWMSRIVQVCVCVCVCVHAYAHTPMLFGSWLPLLPVRIAYI